MRLRVIAKDIKAIVTGTYTIMCNVVDDYVDMFEAWADKVKEEMQHGKKGK